MAGRARCLWLGALLGLCACGGTTSASRGRTTPQAESCLELRLTPDDERALGFGAESPLAGQGGVSPRAAFLDWLEQEGNVDEGAMASFEGAALRVRGEAGAAGTTCHRAHEQLVMRSRAAASSASEFLAAELRRAQQTAAEVNVALDVFDADHPPRSFAPGSADALDRQRLARQLANAAVQLQELSGRLGQSSAARHRVLDPATMCRPVVCGD